MERAEYPEEIWLHTPWPDHPRDISKLWSQDEVEGGVRYIREDMVSLNGAKDADNDLGNG